MHADWMLLYAQILLCLALLYVAWRVLREGTCFLLRQRFYRKRDEIRLYLDEHPELRGTTDEEVALRCIRNYSHLVGHISILDVIMRREQTAEPDVVVKDKTLDRMINEASLQVVMAIFCSRFYSYLTMVIFAVVVTVRHFSRDLFKNRLMDVTRRILPA